MEYTQEKKRDRWLVYVNGSLAQEGGGVGIFLIGLGKKEFKYSIKFKFLITNNMAEYEALLSGLRLVKKIWAERVTLFTDSQLIAQQVMGEYGVKDSLLARYHSMVGQM